MAALHRDATGNVQINLRVDSILGLFQNLNLVCNYLILKYIYVSIYKSITIDMLNHANGWLLFVFAQLMNSQLSCRSVPNLHHRNDQL